MSPADKNSHQSHISCQISLYSLVHSCQFWLFLHTIFPKARRECVLRQIPRHKLILRSDQTNKCFSAKIIQTKQSKWPNASSQGSLGRRKQQQCTATLGLQFHHAQYHCHVSHPQRFGALSGVAIGPCTGWRLTNYSISVLLGLRDQFKETIKQSQVSNIPDH